MRNSWYISCTYTRAANLYFVPYIRLHFVTKQQVSSIGGRGGNTSAPSIMTWTSHRQYHALSLDKTNKKIKRKKNMHNCMTNSPSYGHTDMRYMKYAHTFLPSRTTFISCRDEDYCRQKMKAIPVLIRHSCLTSGQSPAATRTRARRVFTHYGQRRPSNPMPRVAK